MDGRTDGQMGRQTNGRLVMERAEYTVQELQQRRRTCCIFQSSLTTHAFVVKRLCRPTTLRHTDEKLDRLCLKG